MLADLFYLAISWLLPAFALLLLLGPRWRDGGFLLSALYLVFITSLGDAIALAWFRLPPWLVIGASGPALGAGLLLIWALRDWNAAGQVFLTFSLLTTGLYLFYAFFITA